MAELSQIWHMQWAMPNDLAEWDRSGVPYMTNARLTKLVHEAYEAGTKGAKQKQNREGIVTFGKEVRERADRLNQELPYWLRDLLSEFNIPELEAAQEDGVRRG